MTKTGQYQRSISGIHWLETGGALATGAMFVLAVICASAAQAQTYTVQHRFQGSPADGFWPSSERLVGGPPGNLYGTATTVVFKVDESGETVLYRFAGGLGSYGGLVRDSAGNLYGTINDAVFKLDTAGKYTALYTFTGGADGGQPRAGLVRDSAGNLYGTTQYGGASGVGVVFKLDMTGTETVLHSFTVEAGAYAPSPSRLTLDSAGNLYGTTEYGGIVIVSGGQCPIGCGGVFKLDTTGTLTVLHSFTGEADGGNPVSGVMRDSAGNLYGTTQFGGIGLGNLSFGVVFKLDTTGKETVLHTFTGGADGANPVSGVIRDSAGNLYGTSLGNGGVFKLDTTGTLTVLHSFTGIAGGGNPGSLVRDSAGNLYGSTTYGGMTGPPCNPNGCGVVFKLTP